MSALLRIRRSTLAYLILGLVSIVFVADTVYVYSGPAVSDENLAVRLTISVAEIAVWFSAAYGAASLGRYAATIPGTPDGKALRLISWSLACLVAYIVLLSVSGAILRSLENFTALRAAILLTHLVPLFVLLAATLLLFIGSQRLDSLLHRQLWTLPRALLVAVFGIVFFLLLGSHISAVGGHFHDANNQPVFVYPGSVLLVIYVLPYTACLVFGTMSCLNLALYAQKVRGIVYRLLFRNLYKGLLIIYSAIIFAQFLIIYGVSLSDFNPLVALSYGIILLALFGFTLVGRGTRQLASLEKV